MNPIGPVYVRADLDAAKQLLRLVELMPPSKRLAWLGACCRAASVGGSEIRVIAAPITVKGWLADLWTILGQGRLTAEVAVRLAEESLKSEPHLLPCPGHHVVSDHLLSIQRHTAMPIHKPH